MGNSFGTQFKITTWGESHGHAVGVIVDGCVPNLRISLEEIQAELDRRRPGQNLFVSPRGEEDRVQILSGIVDGVTLGTPISMLCWNTDCKTEDYKNIAEKYRPGHADYTYQAKYGILAQSGGGRASARETVGRVAAGAIAKKFLSALHGVNILAYVKQVGDLVAEVNEDHLTLEEVESSFIRCPDRKVEPKMIQKIDQMKTEGNSIGGVIKCIAKGVPAGYGEPVFDKLEADLAKSILSIPACRGFEIGSGFHGVSLTGKEHNDIILKKEEKRILTATNHSGGIQGGISNGMPIVIAAAFKAPSTICIPQASLDFQGNPVVVEGKGRHDPCVLPRAVPIVEAMVAIVLADHALQRTMKVNSLL